MPAACLTPPPQEVDEMTIEVSDFQWVPPSAQGVVRDLRVRWALEDRPRNGSGVGTTGAGRVREAMHASASLRAGTR